MRESLSYKVHISTIYKIRTETATLVQAREKKIFVVTWLVLLLSLVLIVVVEVGV
jgi:hypothetical protein